VDHKSLVRWKQADIHEKREARKKRIAEYQRIIATNDVLIPRIQDILKEVENGGPEKYSSIVEKLQTQPSDAKPAGGSVPYDIMIRDVLLKIKDDLKGTGVDKPDTTELVKTLSEHLEKLVKANNDAKSALEDELREQTKKITSEDIHEGFSSSNITKEPAPEPEKEAKATRKPATKKPEIEVLNPNRPSHGDRQPTAPADDDGDDDDDDDPERIPDLSPKLLEFSQIPVHDFERSYKFIQNHPREVMRPGSYDELVIAGFRAAVKGRNEYAKQCVHQALLIQYSEKLGRDGVQLFFKRMSTGDPRALMVFDKDVEDTYKLLSERAAKAAKEEEAGGKERIQLVAEDPTQTISFNVPDGPPPAEIKIEGPGTENLDPVEVRQALQRRWEIFEGFEPNLQAALKTGNLVEVNDVLGEMEIPRAEEVVQLLDIAGILSFSQQGIVDETGKASGSDEVAEA